MSSNGTIYNIQHFSVHDGPGIRTTVFFTGCPLTCWWCHNPESRSAEIEHMNGSTIGKTYTVQELFDILKKDIIFYDQSGGGVTFSGGEPVSQVDFLSEILKLCHANGIHTAIDTSGFADQGSFAKILPDTDLFLYDLKLMDPDLHKKYTSVSNICILKNLDFLLRNKARVIIRIPLVPEITNTEINIGLVQEFLGKYHPLPEINLLPYHRTAVGKYEKLNIKSKMTGSRELTKHEIENTLQLFRSSGHQVKLGG